MMYRQMLAEKVSPGLYLCEKTGKGLLVEKDGSYFFGSIRVKGNRYRYFQYRDGKKVIQKYIGKARPAHWLPDY